MRILGIDYGEKKIGTAFGDSETHIAVPWDVIRYLGAQTIQYLVELVHREAIDLVVVGVPMATGNHHTSEQLEKTRAFIAALAQAVSVPVEEEDESYTTAESIRLQREEGSPAGEDALAAMLIVRAFLEKQSEREG